MFICCCSPDFDQLMNLILYLDCLFVVELYLGVMKFKQKKGRDFGCRFVGFFPL